MNRDSVSRAILSIQAICNEDKTGHQIVNDIYTNQYIQHDDIDSIYDYLFRYHDAINSQGKAQLSENVYRTIVKEKICYDNFFETHYSELKEKKPFDYKNIHKPSAITRALRKLLTIALFGNELVWTARQIQLMKEPFDIKEVLVGFFDIIVGEYNFFNKFFKKNFTPEFITIQFECGCSPLEVVIINRDISTLQDLYSVLYAHPLFHRRMSFQAYINKSTRYMLRKLILDSDSIKLLNFLANQFDPIFIRHSSDEDIRYIRANSLDTFYRINVDRINTMKLESVDVLLELNNSIYPLRHIDLTEETCLTFTKENFKKYLSKIYVDGFSINFHVNIENRLFELIDKETLREHFKVLKQYFSSRVASSKLEEIFTIKDMIEILEGA